MSRYRGRFGLPALTTPEAFVAWLVLTTAVALALLGIGELFDITFPGFVMGAALWIPLIIVFLTPKKRSRTKE
jgi:hypothetical protein